MPPPPQFRAKRGPPLPHGEGEACFWLDKPGGGRGSCELLRLVFHNLFCPMGSGGQLGLYSEYFPGEEMGAGGKNTKGESEFTQKQHRNGVVFDIFSTKMSKQYS